MLRLPADSAVTSSEGNDLGSSVTNHYFASPAPSREKFLAETATGLGLGQDVDDFYQKKETKLEECFTLLKEDRTKALKCFEQLITCYNELLKRLENQIPVLLQMSDSEEAILDIQNTINEIENEIKKLEPALHPDDIPITKVQQKQNEERLQAPVSMKKQTVTKRTRKREKQDVKQDTSSNFEAISKHWGKGTRIKIDEEIKNIKDIVAKAKDMHVIEINTSDRTTFTEEYQDPFAVAEKLDAVYEEAFEQIQTDFKKELVDTYGSNLNLSILNGEEGSSLLTKHLISANQKALEAKQKLWDEFLSPSNTEKNKIEKSYINFLKKSSETDRQKSINGLQQLKEDVKSQKDDLIKKPEELNINELKAPYQNNKDELHSFLRTAFEEYERESILLYKNYTMLLSKNPDKTKMLNKEYNNKRNNAYISTINKIFKEILIDPIEMEYDPLAGVIKEKDDKYLEEIISAWRPEIREAIHNLSLRTNEGVEKIQDKFIKKIDQMDKIHFKTSFLNTPHRNKVIMNEYEDFSKGIERLITIRWASKIGKELNLNFIHVSQEFVRRDMLETAQEIEKNLLEKFVDKDLEKLGVKFDEDMIIIVNLDPEKAQSLQSDLRKIENNAKQLKGVLLAKFKKEENLNEEYKNDPEKLEGFISDKVDEYKNRSINDYKRQVIEKINNGVDPKVKVNFNIHEQEIYSEIQKEVLIPVKKIVTLNKQNASEKLNGFEFPSFSSVIMTMLITPIIIGFLTLLYKFYKPSTKEKLSLPQQENKTDSVREDVPTSSTFIEMALAKNKDEIIDEGKMEKELESFYYFVLKAKIAALLEKMAEILNNHEEEIKLRDEVDYQISIPIKESDKSGIKRALDSLMRKKDDPFLSFDDQFKIIHKEIEKSKNQLAEHKLSDCVSSIHTAMSAMSKYCGDLGTRRELINKALNVLKGRLINQAESAKPTLISRIDDQIEIINKKIEESKNQLDENKRSDCLESINTSMLAIINYCQELNQRHAIMKDELEALKNQATKVAAPENPEPSINLYQLIKKEERVQTQQSSFYPISSPKQEKKINAPLKEPSIENPPPQPAAIIPIPTPQALTDHNSETKPEEVIIVAYKELKFNRRPKNKKRPQRNKTTSYFAPAPIYTIKETLDNRIKSLFNIIKKFGQFFPKREETKSSLEITLGRCTIFYFIVKLCEYCNLHYSNQTIANLRHLICHDHHSLNNNDNNDNDANNAFYDFITTFKDEYKKQDQSEGEIIRCSNAILASVKQIPYISGKIEEYIAKNNKTEVADYTTPQLDIVKDIRLLAEVYQEKILTYFPQRNLDATLKEITATEPAVYYTLEFLLQSVGENLTSMKLRIDESYLHYLRNRVGHDIGRLNFESVHYSLSTVLPHAIDVLVKREIQINHEYIELFTPPQEQEMRPNGPRNS